MQDAEICRYVTRYGHYVFSDSMPLIKRYFARNPEYEFINGRLAQIDFRTSIDAFSDLVAWLDQKYGASNQYQIPDKLRNGGAQYRVERIWRAPKGIVSLIDPSSDPVELEVRIATR